jgi:hypothetical protein
MQSYTDEMFIAPNFGEKFQAYFYSNIGLREALRIQEASSLSEYAETNASKRTTAAYYLTSTTVKLKYTW